MKKSFLLHVQLVRGFTWYLRGRCALASIEAVPAEASSRLAEAHRLGARLLRTSAPWAPVFGSIVTAGVELARGDRSAAMASLRAAIAGAGDAQMSIHGAAARHQLGLLIGGEAGQVLVQQGDDEMAARGVRAPARTASRLVPGRWGEK